MKHLYLAALLSSLTAPALALQGSDACATASPISGQGSFGYDNTAATTGTDGQTEALCYQFGSSVVENDIWFSWTSDCDMYLLL